MKKSTTTKICSSNNENVKDVLRRCWQIKDLYNHSYTSMEL